VVERSAANRYTFTMILASVTSSAWWMAALAILAYGAVSLSVRWGRAAVQAALAAAWLAHGLTLLHSVVLQGRFGFGPAVSVTAWLVLSVYAIEMRWFAQMGMRWVLAGLGALTVLLAVLFPGQPLQMRASPWLAVHLALAVASYGLLAAAVVHAGLMTRAEKQIRSADVATGGIPLLTYERLTFSLVAAAFVLLTATLAAGWWFGEQLYGLGKAWRWDHKTIFSVLAWLCLLWLCVGRWRFGWRGRQAVKTLYAAAALLLLAYVGSRFVLEVVLHRSASSL
jgi:ABC-type uncharacterized transport system permease subunit